MIAERQGEQVEDRSREFREEELSEPERVQREERGEAIDSGQRADIREDRAGEQRKMEADGRKEPEKDRQNQPGKDMYWESERVEQVKKERHRKRGYRLTGSLAAKIVVFFLLGISFLVGAWATVGFLYIGEYGFYSESYDEILMDALRGPGRRVLYEVAGSLEWEDLAGAAEACQGKNIRVEMIRLDKKGETVLWSSGESFETNYIIEDYIEFGRSTELTLKGYTLQNGEVYLYRGYIRPDFPEQDEFQRIEGLVNYVHEFRYALIGVAAGSIFLFIISFLFLMCGAGHRNGQEGVVPGVMTGIPWDVLTGVFGGGALFVGYAALAFGSRMGDSGVAVLLSVAGVLLVVWMTIYCMDFAIRLKLGKCFRNSLIYLVMRGTWRILRLMGRGFVQLMKGIPLVLTTVTVYLGLCILEFIGVAHFIWEKEGILLWAFEKMLLFPIVLYVALACRKLWKAGEKLAEGQGDYKVDTSRLIGEFKEHGEHLNSLGEGISRAVAERMKSERLKTELITNVSHDLKTPLTSIINYADLIYEEAVGRSDRSGKTASTDMDGIHTEKGEAQPPENARIADYARVLLRQSRRLKKLLEDLLEASKATTGNLEVNLEPCEVGVLLSQAVGEYQQRMEEKELELIARQPEEPVNIMADGRHLWRVFDNLLNNICKYAQERTRVYLSVETKEGYVRIIFRNMSKYPLDISSEELEERFVRGDKSRHMEGNGLGLSIAKSLIDLQGGKMDITIDGDLFKVTLRFVAM